MKFFAVIAAATLAVASAANCELAALGPVVLGANGVACTAKSGMSFLPPSVPNAATVEKLCAASECRALLQELKKAAPTECTVDIATPPLQLYAQLLTPLQNTCEGPATSGPTTAPSPGATPAPTTKGDQGQTKPTPAPTKDDSC